MHHAKHSESYLPRNFQLKSIVRKPIMHGCFRAGNNQVIIELGKPNCQPLTSQKDCSSLEPALHKFIQGLDPPRDIHRLVHLVLLHAGLGPDQHACGAPGSHWASKGSGKWGRPQMWPLEIIRMGPETEPPTGLRPKKIWPFEFWKQEVGSPCQTWPEASPNAVFLELGKLLGFPKPWSQSVPQNHGFWYAHQYSPQSRN